jgi:hypothetical protein
MIGTIHLIKHIAAGGFIVYIGHGSIKVVRLKEKTEKDNRFVFWETLSLQANLIARYSNTKSQTLFYLIKPGCIAQ